MMLLENMGLNCRNPEMIPDNSETIKMIMAYFERAQSTTLYIYQVNRIKSKRNDKETPPPGKKGFLGV